jgi:hypothetical protein
MTYMSRSPSGAENDMRSVAQESVDSRLGTEPNRGLLNNRMICRPRSTRKPRAIVADRGNLSPQNDVTVQSFNETVTITVLL